MSARPWIRSGKGTAASRQEMILRSGARSATPVQPVVATEQVIGQRRLYSVGAPFERIAINIAGPSHEVTKETSTS
jgi:hypothetical protein